MSFDFPHAKPRKLGYDPVAVNQFIERARAEFTADHNGDVLTIADQEFPLVKGGYSVTAVDVALDRLEDAFVARKFKQQLSDAGSEALMLAPTRSKCC